MLTITPPGLVPLQNQMNFHANMSGSKYNSREKKNGQIALTQTGISYKAARDTENTVSKSCYYWVTSHKIDLFHRAIGGVPNNGNRQLNQVC
jgi:hypothetical protein